MIYFLLMGLWESVKSFDVAMKASGSGATLHEQVGEVSKATA